MDTDVPPSEAIYPAGADSHLRQSSLISATAFADVDALTISPAAAAGSAAVIMSKVRLSILFPSLYIILWIHIIRELYEFI